MHRTLRDLAIIVTVIMGSSFAVWGKIGLEKIYQNFDGPYYLVIAQCMYDRACIGKNFSFPLPLEYYPAHFPLYPALINTVSLIGVNHLQAMLLVTLLSTLAASVVLYKLIDENKWGNPLWITLAWLFIWPRMWAVRVVGSPETLMMLGLLLSWLFFERKNYLLTAIFGVFTVLAKPPGILLFVAYGIWFLFEMIQKRKIHWKSWILLVMPIALLGVFGLFYFKTGDFMAYFHSGDNIHLQIMPFKIFDSNQPWVGTFWLEDVLWIYLIGMVGVAMAYKKSKLLSIFGGVFLTTIFFVSHRDIARYSLPIVPVVLIGISQIFERKEVKIALGFLVVPMFFYTVNFLMHNLAGVANWAPFL